ncbi:MAG TPA: class I SAM-dependent methyltransferase [Propionibacteriaceae bacterium]|nr:class I SAM-dependent methyltransferase [Propionibacteriaceae bacterium]
MITNENLTAAFDEVAPRYDLMVALNPGYHAHLRMAAHGLVEWLPRSLSGSEPPLIQLLDLGCGSGASTRAVLEAAQAAGLRFAIVGADASAGMLDQARAKSWPASVRFEVGQAEELVGSHEWLGLDDPIQAVFAAYLFRNVAERDKLLAGLFDVLADGGVLVVQEYSIAGSRLWSKALWTAVCWLAIIPLGWLTSRRSLLYRYLWRSVRLFDSVQAFVDRLYGAGFVDVEVRTVPGWQRGILHTFRARKPAAAP